MADQQRRVSLIFEADTSRAKASINELVSSLRNISATPTDIVNLANVQQATRAAMELEHHLQRAVNVDTGKLDLGRFATSLERSGTNLQQYLTTLNKIGPAGNQTFKNLATAINNASTSTTRLSKGMANFMTTMKNTVKWQISSSIMHGMISSVQQAYGYAKSLDKTLNDIRIVSGHSAAEMSRFAESANRAAQQLRTTTDQYAKASLIFYQQGLGDAEIEKRTAAVIKMANVTGEAVKDVSSYMTAIWNNFDEGGRSLESFADVMTALGAATASSSAEIAGGLEKFVAIGEQIGLSFDYAATALATITAQTRQSEDVVGNALKTIFARIQGLNLGETLDDGTTLNKYSEALAKVGINIKDTSGQIKDMDVILNEMGSKWQTFGKDTQIALAQAVAGVRQYNQVMSLMNDWDVFKHNLDIAKNSKGTLNKQADIYAESWEASTKQVKNALQSVYDALFDAEPFMKLNSFLTDTLGVVKGLVKAAGGLGPILQAAFGTFLSAKAQQAPVFLQNMLDNFKVMAGFGQTKAQQTQSQMTQALLTKANQSTNNAEKMEFQQLANVSAMREKVLGIQHLLNSEQQRSVQLQLQQAQAAGDLATKKEQELEAERQILAQARQKAAMANVQAGAQRNINRANEDKGRAEFLHQKSINIPAAARSLVQSRLAVEKEAEAKLQEARAAQTRESEAARHQSTKAALERELAENERRAQANKDFYNQNMAIAGKGDKNTFFTTTSGYRETKGGLQSTYNEQKAQTDQVRQELLQRIAELDQKYNALMTDKDKEALVAQAEQKYEKAKANRQDAEKDVTKADKLGKHYAEQSKKAAAATDPTKALAAELQARKQLTAEVGKYVEVSGKLGQVSTAAAEIGAAYQGQKTSVVDLQNQIKTLIDSSDAAKKSFNALGAEDQQRLAQLLEDPKADAKELLALLEKLGVKAGELNLKNLDQMENKVMSNNQANMTEEEKRDLVNAARGEAHNRGQLPINPAPKPQLEIPIPTNLQVVTQTITAMAGAAMTANSAMNSLRNAMDIWSDEDATPFEIVGAALSLMTTGMMFFNSASKIGNAITAKRIALQRAQAASGAAVAAGEAAATAGINSNTGAVVANTAAWMSNPIGLIITMVIMALAAVFAIATKAIENNTKKLKENAEAARENADAVSEEVSEREKLVKTYYDELSVYEKTKSNKEALADAAREVAEAYKLENAQMLIAQGNYEALNKLIGEAGSSDRKKLMDAKGQELSTQLALKENEYGKEGFDPDKHIKSYTRGENTSYSLASDDYEIISEQEAASIDSLASMRSSIAASIETYASDIADAGKVVELAGQTFVTVTQDGVDYLVGANGQIYENVEAAMKAKDPSLLIASTALDLYTAVEGEITSATGSIEAGNIGPAIADTVVTYADHVANIADSGSTIAVNEAGKVENAVKLFSANLQNMASGNAFTQFFTGSKDRVGKHQENAENYMAGYITEASKVGSDNILMGEYASSRDDSVISSEEAARMLASQLWNAKEGSTFADLDIFKDYDAEELNAYMQELGYATLPKTVDEIIDFVSQFYNVSDTLTSELRFLEGGQKTTKGLRVPLQIPGQEGAFEYDLISGLIYSSGSDAQVLASEIFTGFTKDAEGNSVATYLSSKYGGDNTPTLDQLMGDKYIDEEVVKARRNSAEFYGSGLQNDSPYMPSDDSTYYYADGTYVRTFGSGALEGTNEQNAQLTGVIFAGASAKGYHFNAPGEEDLNPTSRVIGGTDTIAIDAEAMRAAAAKSSGASGTTFETPDIAKIGVDEGGLYSLNSAGEKSYISTPDAGIAFNSEEAINSYNAELEKLGIGGKFNAGEDGLVSYNSQASKNNLDYYLYGEGGGTAAERYESFMGYRGNRVTVDEVSSIAEYFSSIDPKSADYAKQFMGSNGLNTSLAAQFFAGSTKEFDGKVMSPAQARILAAYAGNEDYKIEGNEGDGFSVYKLDENKEITGDAVFKAAGVSEGIVLEVPDDKKISDEDLKTYYPNATRLEDGSIQLMTSGGTMSPEDYEQAKSFMDQFGLADSNEDIYKNIGEWLEVVDIAKAYDEAAKAEVIYGKTKGLGTDASSASVLEALGIGGIGTTSAEGKVSSNYAGYRADVAKILGDTFFTPEEVEEILINQGFAEQGKALRHVMENAQTDFQLKLLEAYDGLSDDQKTVFFTLDFNFLTNKENIEGQIQEVVGYITSLNDAVNAEQYKIKAEKAKESWADVDTVEELKDFETSSGIQWGAESGLDPEGDYGTIISYSEFLAKSHEEQISYINGLVAAYDEGYGTIVQNGIQASKDLIEVYKNSRDVLLTELFKGTDTAGKSTEDKIAAMREKYQYDAVNDRWLDVSGKETKEVSAETAAQLKSIDSLINSISSEEIRIEGFEEDLKLEVVLNRREYDAFIKETLGTTITVGVVFEVDDTEQLERLLGDLSKYGFKNSEGKFVVTANPEELHNAVVEKELTSRSNKSTVGDFTTGEGQGSEYWYGEVQKSHRYSTEGNWFGSTEPFLNYVQQAQKSGATVADLGLTNYVTTDNSGNITGFVNTTQATLEAVLLSIKTFESSMATDLPTLLAQGIITSYKDLGIYENTFGASATLTPEQQQILNYNFATSHGMSLASYNQGLQTTADSAEAGYMDVFGGATLNEQYQNRILAEEQLTAEGYSGAEMIASILADALSGKIELKDQEDLNNAIGEQKEVVGVYNSESAISGISTEEIKERVEYLEKYGDVLDKSASELVELATAELRFERGIENGREGIDDWTKALKKADKTADNWEDTLTGIEDVYEDLFDIKPGKLSKEFVESAENAELLQKALEGSEESMKTLRKKAADDLFDGEEIKHQLDYEQLAEGKTIDLKMGVDEESWDTTLDTVEGYIDQMNNKTIEPSIAMDGINSALDDLVFNSAQAAKDASDSLSSMGVNADIVEHVVHKDGSHYTKTAEGSWFKIGQDGVAEEQPISAEIVMQEGSETQRYFTLQGKNFNGGVNRKISKPTSRGGGGGGGGGGSRKPQARKKKEPEKERYHTVKNQLEDLTDAYDKVSKAAERAFGKSRIKLLREQQEALKDLAATQQDYIDEINSYYKQDLSNLDQVSQYIGFDVQLDENGTITNFNDIQNAMWDEYNSHINDNEEVTDMDEEAWKKYEEEWNRIMELITTYEDTQDLRKDALQQLQDYINDIYDLQLEEVTYAVEVDIEASDDALKILDYMLSRIEDDAWAAAEAITYMGDKAATILDQNNTYTSGIRDILMNHTQDIKDSDGKVLQKAQLSKADVEGFMAGDAEAIDKIMKLNDAFTQEEVENLRDYHNSLIEMNESLVELRESVFDKVLDSFEKFNEEMDKSIEKIDHLSAVTENYKNIIDIVGKKNLNISNALLDSLNQANVEQRINRVDATRTKRDTIAAEITRAEAALADARSKGLEEDAKLWEKTLEEMRSSLDEAEEDFMQSWEDALDSIREQFEEAVGHAVEALSDALAGPLMGSMDQLQDAFDRQNTIAERYLPDYEKIYELNKLNRDITNSIDETDNIKAKQELAKLQAEINALEESEAEISEYQMENLRRRYELKMAEIALTEAQDAKSQVQMSRDADGNWSYVYTANEDQVAEAEQNYEDRLFAIQQANAEYINAMQESMVQLEAEMAQKIEEIMLDETLSAEEKMAKLQEVTTFYQGQMEYYMDELELVLGENQVLYEQDWTKYNELTGYKISANQDYVDNFNETALSTLTGFQTMEEFQQNFNDAIGHPDSHGLLYDLSQAYDTWAANTEAAMNAAGTSVSDFADDMAEDVDKILDASEEATDAIEDMGEKVVDTFDQLTDAVENWSQVYSAKIDEILQKNTALAESFNKLLQAWSDYNESTTDDSTDAPSEEEPTDDGEPADEGADVPDTIAEKTEKYKKGIAFAIWSHPSSGWGHGNSSKNLTSGDRYNRLKAKGLDPNTVQQQINAYRGKSTDYMKKDSGISFKKWSDRVRALNPYTYKKFAFDTGGYTGDWGEEGRWALLHSKEIVLNKDDTANLLSAVDMIRQISKAIDLNAYSSAGYGNSIIKAGIGEGGTLEQNVHITAEFPNATNREEIYSAFTDIINLASQYANRK